MKRAEQSVASAKTRERPRITEVMAVAAASPGVPTADWWELTSFESQPVNLSGWRFNDNAGGLTDPYTIAGPLTIAPGESIILAEQLTPMEFTNWWGATNLPAGLQIINYNGSGLGLGAGGDGLRLWDNLTMDVNDTVASVDFGTATAGVTFNYNPDTQQFGALSQLGVNGVFGAAAASDIGSPGRIRGLAPAPLLQAVHVGDQLRIEFDAVAGRRYTLEVRDDFTADDWTATGDVLQPQRSGRVFFERSMALGAHFFRVSVE